MSSLLEISCPVSIIETDIENQIISGYSVNSSFLTETQDTLHTSLLTDRSRLQEIYDLRLAVWEHSGKSEFVNRKLFPNGWHDELDDVAFHWITTNDQNKIIASARLNIFQSFAEFPYYSSMKHLSFPNTKPFAFYSRLVVHPEYRNNGLSRQLFDGRTAFCKEKDITWSQVFINNPYIIDLFEKSGYKSIGHAKVNYHSSSQPHSVNVFIKESNYG